MKFESGYGEVIEELHTEGMVEAYMEEMEQEVKELEYAEIDKLDAEINDFTGMVTYSISIQDIMT